MGPTLVIGATGRVGREVVTQLAAVGTRVRALVRSPQTAGLPTEVEVAPGDLTVPESLEKCLDGVDAVFLVWTAPPDGVPAALERIAGRARRIVFLSSPYQTAHPLFQSGQPNPVTALHMEIERRIAASGVEWTFLRPGMFAANARWWWAPAIRAGEVVRWPYLAAPTAPIDERDIAAVAVRALREQGHGGAEYVLTGPESLSQREQIATIGEAIGRELRIEEMSPEEAKVPKMLLDAWAAAVGQPAHITSTVAEITGTPARTFRQWAWDRRSFFVVDQQEAAG